jgi:hypothetical protein
VFVVHSDEREHYERGMRELSMERARKDLEALRLRVEEGELKEAEKIGAAAAKALVRNHGHRYFGWELRRHQFRHFEHPVNFRRERACEGKYVIQIADLIVNVVQPDHGQAECAQRMDRHFSRMLLMGSMSITCCRSSSTGG